MQTVTSRGGCLRVIKEAAVAQQKGQRTGMVAWDEREWPSVRGSGLQQYSFPIATMANYHKLGSLKQIYSLRILETRSPKAKVLAGLHSFWRLWGRIHLLAFFDV